MPCRGVQIFLRQELDRGISVAHAPQEKPLVVLLGWLGAQERYFQKYACPITLSTRLLQPSRFLIIETRRIVVTLTVVEVLILFESLLAQDIETTSNVLMALHGKQPCTHPDALPTL